MRQNLNTNSMKRLYLLLPFFLIAALSGKAQNAEDMPNGLTIATIVGETKTATSPQVTETIDTLAEIPLWKQKLYYGYNFDIYYHHDSRAYTKENGFSIAVQPELGWKLKDRLYLGLRLGGSYQNLVTTYSFEAIDTTYTTDLRIHQGSWEVVPYARYQLKSLLDGKIGIWLEAHLYTGMQFPTVTAGEVRGTDYDGLRHSISYGFQLSPVITFKFNRKSTFQVFFSILSLGYSGTTFCYSDPLLGDYKEYTNDVIIFSGKLRNLIANQFTPGLYGLKFGVMKSF